MFLSLKRHNDRRVSPYEKQLRVPVEGGRPRNSEVFPLVDRHGNVPVEHKTQARHVERFRGFFRAADHFAGEEKREQRCCWSKRKRGIFHAARQ